MRRIGDDIEVDDGERDVTQIGTFQDVSAELEAERALAVALQREADRREANRRLREAWRRPTVQLAVSPPMPLPIITVPPPDRSWAIMGPVVVGLAIGAFLLGWMSVARGMVTVGW